VDVVLAGPLEAVRAVAQEITEVLSGALRNAGNNKLQPAAQTTLTPDRRARRDARRGPRRRVVDGIKENDPAQEWPDGPGSNRASTMLISGRTMKA
jgi:hypothetical protein